MIFFHFFFFVLVCELHFHSEDIKRETSANDKKKNRYHNYCYASLWWCNPYNSTQLFSIFIFNNSLYRITRLHKNSTGEFCSLDQSITDDLEYKKQKKFNGIDDLEGMLNFLNRNYWRIVRQQEILIICCIIKSTYPKICLL